jgi:hypothetical protein
VLGSRVKVVAAASETIAAVGTSRLVHRGIVSRIVRQSWCRSKVERESVVIADERRTVLSTE